MNWTTKNIPSQSGRRVVITGANSGIGFHAALEFARCGAALVLPARTKDKADDAIRRIHAEVPNAELTPAILDLASLESVRSFAQFYDRRFPGRSLDLLVNNAGVMALPNREVTADGFERQFATNYLQGKRTHFAGKSQFGHCLTRTEAMSFDRSPVESVMPPIPLVADVPNFLPRCVDVLQAACIG